MKRIAFLVAILICLAALAQDKPTTDPWAGTWKLNVSKSKFHDPAMAPKDETVQTEPQDPGSNVIKWSAQGTDASGKSFTENFDGKADGQPYPFLRDGQEAGKISYQKVNSHQYSSKGTLADGTTSSGVIRLSKDGKTIAIKEHVKTKQGEFDDIEVFEKAS